VLAFLAAHRDEVFPDAMFADLFPSGRGRPSLPAPVVASVLVLQALHGLSDREAAEAVTFDLRWKAACGLPVTAPAFHPTTLTYWRGRLARSQRPNRVFEAVRELVAQTSALRGKTRGGAGLHSARRRGRHPGHRDPADRRGASGRPHTARRAAARAGRRVLLRA
jgi:hypothetical protein